MKRKIYILLIILFFLFLFFGKLVFNFHKVFVAEGATVQATIKITVCGNNIKETNEQCDNADLGGATCSNQGFNGGTLSCSASCDFNTSSCTSSGGGGGGGGGGGSGGGGSEYIPPQTKANFSGKAYPNSAVTLLKDAQIAATTIAGTDANFQISVSGMTGGNYIFSIYSEDNKGNRSSLLTFPISISSGTTTNVSGIFITPTITLDKSEVEKGENISIFGQSIPRSEITISVASDKDFFTKTIADESGAYLYNLNTSSLETGQHFTKSKAALNGEISSFSKTISFIVGTKNVFIQSTAATSKGDLNNDKRVNLVDFSITAYWYKRPSPPNSIDLNGDNKIDLVDFSIMAYYWTG